jgi:hypothetical protein
MMFDKWSMDGVKRELKFDRSSKMAPHQGEVPCEYAELEESTVSSSGSQFNVPGRTMSVVNNQLLFGFNRQLVELNNYGVLLYEKGD